MLAFSKLYTGNIQEFGRSLCSRRPFYRLDSQAQLAMKHVKQLKCTKYFNFVQKMHIIPLSEFRAHASAMIDLVEKGETVRILRHGKPVAELVPLKTEVAARLPSWKRPVEPLRYLKPPVKSGAQMIIEEREGGG